MTVGEAQQETVSGPETVPGPNAETEAAVLAVLDGRRFLTVAQLHAELSVNNSGGSATSIERLRSVLAESGEVHSVGAVVFSSSSLLADRVFTVAHDGGTVQSNIDDLAPLVGSQKRLSTPIEGVAVSAGGRTIVTIGAVPTEIGESPGYLAIGGPADLRAAQFGAMQPDQFRVATVAFDRLSSGEVEAAALRAAIDEVLPTGHGLSARPLIAYAMYLNGHCFRAPTLPISDLLTAVGLEHREGEWGRAGEAWSTTAEGYTNLLLDELTNDYRLDPAAAESFRAAAQAWVAWNGVRPQLDPGAFVAHLTPGRVASAFAEYWQPRTTTKLESWMSQRRLVETLAKTHSSEPVVSYLRGMIDLRLGDGATAMEFFQMANEADAAFLPARYELGTLMLDAGSVPQALTVLPEDSMLWGAVDAVLAAATLDRAKADRSDPCRCGSDKKYRSCCAKELHLSDLDLTALREIRLQHFLSVPPWSMQMDRLADIVSTECGLMSFPEALAEPIVQDVLVVEGGGAGAYLAARRSLLPAHEVALLSQFTARRRKAFDVRVDGSQLELTHPDSSLHLRIPAHRVDGLVAGPGAFSGPETAFLPGDALLVRTVKVDDVLLPSGPAIRIPSAHVSLLRVTIGSRPTAEQLLGWICRRSEILRPALDLTGEIDLRDDAPSMNDVLATVDVDDLARRAMD